MLQALCPLGSLRQVHRENPPHQPPGEPSARRACTELQIQHGSLSDQRSQITHLLMQFHVHAANKTVDFCLSRRSPGHVRTQLSRLLRRSSLNQLTSHASRLIKGSWSWLARDTSTDSRSLTRSQTRSPERMRDMMEDCKHTKQGNGLFGCTEYRVLLCKHIISEA